MNKPIRILQIVPNVNQTSGILNVVLNWHKYIDTSKVQFDYLYFSKNHTIGQEEEIEKLGGNCFFLSYRNPVRFVVGLVKLFRKNKYQIIHSHISQLPIVIFPLAKFYRAKFFIQHVHNPKWSDKKLNAIRNSFLIHAVWPFITHRIACSFESGKACFGKNFSVINNGIDVEKYTYNPVLRDKKRTELNLQNNLVIGHIGRFNPQKNHKFLINVFEILTKLEPTAKLILVGNGPLKETIKNLVSTKKLKNNVLFVEPPQNVHELLQAIDVFVFPSLFEGLGIVAIEAQAAGLPCVMADTLPKAAFICNFKKMPINSAELWATEIINILKNYKRKGTADEIIQAGYSAQQIAKKMEDFYLNLDNQ